MRRFILAALASFGFYSLPVSADTVAATTTDAEVCEGCEALIELALAHPRREADRARDQYRHPAETLAFFKVKPGMTVVDYMPGGGWYTRILVPYLGSEGRYIALNPAPGSDPKLADNFGGLAQKFPGKAAQWSLEGAQVQAFNSDSLPKELQGTVDRVLVMRQVHNVERFGWLPRELGIIRGLLKPGGLLGIEEHRAKGDAPDAYVDGSKGYMRQKDVIALVEAQGFELVGASEVNANPKDSADHPAGVWELAPTLATKREELRAIGESDRMTLLFRKRGA